MNHKEQNHDKRHEHQEELKEGTDKNSHGKKSREEAKEGRKKAPGVREAMTAWEGSLVRLTGPLVHIFCKLFKCFSGMHVLRVCDGAEKLSGFPLLMIDARVLSYK